MGQRSDYEYAPNTWAAKESVRGLKEGRSEVKEDGICHGYSCGKISEGKCVCSNIRNKRMRDRRKLSPEEIQVSSFFSIPHSLSVYQG